MKKIILLIIVVLGAATLPIIGKNVTQSKLDAKMDELKSFGLGVENPSSDSSYLNTSNHYEFVLKDSDKFIKYLSDMTGEQLPSYTKSLLDGVVIGSDVKYSNLAFASDVVVEIYPLQLPKQSAKDIRDYDVKLYDFVEQFLEEKALLYHINYNLMSRDFDGYIKDMDEKYTDTKGESVNFKILGVTFAGNGSLLKPQKLKGEMKKVAFIAGNKGKEATFVMENLSTETNFKTQTTYDSQMSLESMKLDIDGDYKFHGGMNGFKVSLLSDTQGKKAVFDSKTSVKNFKINSPKGDVTLSNFNYEATLKDIDKDSFEEFRVLVSKADSMQDPLMQDKLEKSMIKMFSKGLVVDLKDLSLAKVDLYKQKSAQGFALKSNIVLKGDKDFEKKLKTFPAELANNLTVDTNFKISKAMFILLNEELPASVLAGGFAKEEGDYLVFDIKLIDSKLSINGQQL